MCFQETSAFKYLFYAQKENSERKQNHHNEYKNCTTLPSVFLLCDCQKKRLVNSGTQLRTSRKGRYAPVLLFDQMKLAVKKKKKLEIANGALTLYFFMTGSPIAERERLRILYFAMMTL